VILQFVNPRLQYISIGTNRYHAHMTQASAADKGRETICGMIISPGSEPEQLREVDVERICKRCYATLRTYSDKFVIAR
jgi:hypothetical protein